MKKIVVIASLLFSLSVAAYAQNYTREGNTFRVEKTEKTKQEDVQTPFFYTMTTKDLGEQTYPIFITARNACYIWRLSKKTCKEYKYYLPKEMSKEIAKELGREVKNEI